MVDGVTVDIGGVRAETLLALLAVRPGVPVSADSLIDELWSGEPPDGAPKTLRSYVSRLRTAFGPPVAIERLPAGYALHVPPESVDSSRFEALARAGLDLRRAGRHRRAAATLRTALAEWRGEPFAGLPRDGSLAAEGARLEELRLNVLEERLESDLDLGWNAELVDEIEALVVEHPFRERLWKQLMLALYRAGRQADALAAYHRARLALDQQLGIEPGNELRDLEAAILRQEVPAPAGAGTRSLAALPAPITSFIGRSQDLEHTRALLLRSRLVTLVGVGGVGKTRLALEVARRATVDIVDEVAFVDLAAITDPALVRAHTASTIGVREAPGEALDVVLVRELGAGATLLVLDNCEHVRDATAAFVHDLLHGAPELRILATSREVLGVAGEATYPVTPLSVPGPYDADDTVRSSEAVRLLVDRATLTRHDLRVDDALYETAARICRELEGLPLAIELAAARTKALSLDEIADRLRDRFQFLVAWRRITAARHRTLREAMDWSYELLAPDEQRLLTQLSVFPASASLPAIAAVCLDGDQEAAERLIERLVDASLVVPVDSARQTRYRLLETVRQYGASRLDPRDRDQLARRHADHVRAIARAAGLALESVNPNMSFEAAHEELASIRSAIQWAADADPALAVEIACALERFWVSSHPQEGAAMFTGLLARDGLTEVLRARALRCRGGCRYTAGSFVEGVADYEAALEIHRRLGQRAYEAHLLLRLGWEAQRVNDPARAHDLLEAATSVGADDRFAPDVYVSVDLAAAIAYAQGREDEAVALQQRAIELASEAGDPWWRHDTLRRLAARALSRGRAEVARPAALEALRLARTINDRQSTIYALFLLGWEAAVTGRHDRAGRIWGGLQAEVDRGGPLGQWELDEDEAHGLIAIGGEAFERAVVRGRTLPLDAVVEFALGSD